MNELNLHMGSCVMTLNLDMLGALPRDSYRAILRQASMDANNAGALLQLGEILQNAVTRAKVVYEAAKTDYAKNWKFVNRKSRTPAALKTLQKNRELNNAVKRTKAQLSTAHALLRIFNEIVNKGDL